MSFKSLIPVLVASVLALATPAAAQPQQPTAAISALAGLDGPSDYEVGPGDLLSINVSGVTEFNQVMRVSNSGRVRVPYVGIMFAAGRTALELEREIAREIREHELVTEPMVRVQVQQYRSRPTYAMGEVLTPGQFVITGEMYLLELISRAGGLTAMADGKAFLYRRGRPRPEVTARISVGPEPAAETPAPAATDTPPVTPETPEPRAAETPAPVPAETPAPVPTETPVMPAVATPVAGEPGDADVIEIDLDELRSGNKPDLNIPLQGGDVLYVPRRKARTFYIIGDVKNPGAYGMPRRGDVSAAQAIVYAGGTVPTAKNGRAFLMRHDANGERQAFPVDFKAIIAGKKPDIPILPEDIIFVPNSAAKTIAIGLLNMIPQLFVQFLIF
jgi:polysaccharide export outer membrane protein